MFGKVSRAKDYACIEVEGSRDLGGNYFCYKLQIYKQHILRTKYKHIYIYIYIQYITIYIYKCNQQQQATDQ